MRSPLACALAIAAGCSSSSTAPDAPNNPCLVPADYGALGSKTGTALVNAGNPTLTIVLDPGPPRDVFFLQLITGQGVFTGGGLMTGTFAIRGADTNFTACGLCTNILGDIVSGAGPTKFYFTASGMVTLPSTELMKASTPLSGRICPAKRWASARAVSASAALFLVALYLATPSQ